MPRMRKFTDIQHDLNLVKFVESPSGNLFCVPVAPGAPRIIVRRFDRDLPATLIPAYISLLAAAEAWIARDADLARVVRVEQPTEIGCDFIARPHVLGTSLSSFADDEDPPEPPDELLTMQARFRARAAAETEARDAFIAVVLARSILEPTAKTMYSFRESKFIVADIKPTRGDLERWAALNPG
jgi:hypothetical protein